ncbi:TetR family transcriptional regulator C-terminal domain-containing protein [Variovorax paradoxus]|nr:TetR family transcriptional regulator C-terminal domain-containing protein [Variovorax paradoxus]
MKTTKTTGHIEAYASSSSFNAFAAMTRTTNAVGNETRRRLIAGGLTEFHARGFHGTGVDAIARTASVPKGSFYNHFESKQTFCAEIVDAYFERHRGKLDLFFNDRSLAPLDRLRAYLDERIEYFTRVELKRGCLMGNLSLELADHEEAVRSRLKDRFDEWAGIFADCIESAQSAGQVSSAFRPSELAGFILNSWEGAILRMRVERTVKPLEIARDFILQSLLR